MGDMFSMEDLQQSEKLWYGIGETSNMLGVPSSTLRFWEKELGIVKPRKNKKGDRFYSKNDITVLRTIKYLTKTKGYTLQGAKGALESNMIKEVETASVVATLQDIRSKLLEIKKLLNE